VKSIRKAALHLKFFVTDKLGVYLAYFYIIFGKSVVRRVSKPVIVQ